MLIEIGLAKSLTNYFKKQRGFPRIFLINVFIFDERVF